MREAMITSVVRVGDHCTMPFGNVDSSLLSPRVVFLKALLHATSCYFDLTHKDLDKRGTVILFFNSRERPDSIIMCTVNCF